MDRAIENRIFHNKCFVLKTMEYEIPSPFWKILEIMILPGMFVLLRWLAPSLVSFYLSERNKAIKENTYAMERLTQSVNEDREHQKMLASKLESLSGEVSNLSGQVGVLQRLYLKHDP